MKRAMLPSYAESGTCPKPGDNIRTCLGAVVLTGIDQRHRDARADDVTGYVVREESGTSGNLWEVFHAKRGLYATYDVSEMLPTVRPASD